jgi:anaerobic magnesium-protoporphyrin IX monomethyl ester cyclase
MKAALIYPPIADPTCGYLSLSYLASYVRAKTDYEIEIIDANIESLDYASRPAHVARLLDSARQKYDRLRSQKLWSKSDRQHCNDLLAGMNLTAEEPANAIALMKDPSRFWDYSEYYRSASVLRRWLNLLATEGIPGQFANFAIPEDCEVNFSNLANLTNDSTLGRLGAPFSDYTLNVLIPRLRTRDVIGIGVTYHEQLPFALYMAREIRHRLPEVPIVMGGTDISQIYKYTRVTDSFKHIFRFADACVIGEGETAFAALLKAYDAGVEQTPKGVVTKASYEAGTMVAPNYEDLDRLPPPSFEDLPWHLYFSPERMIYYAPTRGCYWDRCTFCDYGLADGRPTSPWRQRSINRVLDDLSLLSKEAKFIYFSVDVIAPAYLLKLARGIIDRSIDIRWGAELRLERYFDESQCQLLRESGCIGISVGFESGNQRVLDLIDKGTNVDSVLKVVRSFAAAGTSVQIMGFTGFPTETYDEALDSVRILNDLRSQWVFGGLGKFMLTAGAIVAKKPERFGLKKIGPRDGDDVHCILDFEELEPSKTESEVSAIDAEVDALKHPFELPRPFVGGIDTAHSYFYFDRYGTETRKQLDNAMGTETDESCVELCGTIITDPAAISCISRDDKLHEGEGDELDPIILLNDGRLLPCSWLTAKLARYLDGSHTVDWIEKELSRQSGRRSLLLTTHLHQILDLKLVRFCVPTSTSTR